MVAFEITEESIERVLTASGKSRVLFAEELGISSRALAAYLTGKCLPRRPYIIERLQELASTYGVSAPETVTHSTDADEFSPERLQDFQDKHGLTVTEIARRLGVSKDSWRNWTEGRCYPGRPNTIAALRELLGEVTRKSNVPEAAAVKGGKHQLAATAVHEIANNFHARYQAKMDDILVDNVISHVCETENVERTKLRRETALVIFLLKDRMSMQEIYQRLSGHSS